MTCLFRLTGSRFEGRLANISNTDGGCDCRNTSSDCSASFSESGACYSLKNH